MVNGRVSIQGDAERTPVRGSLKRLGLALAVAAVAGLGATAARADQFFDWLGEIGPGGTTSNLPTFPQADPSNSTTLTLPAGDSYVAAPTLDNSTVSQVQAYLAAQQAAGKPLAVKVRANVTLSTATINTIYNAFNVKYTFVDYEGLGADTTVRTLTDAIKASTATGPSVTANTSYVGNFAIATVSTDPTHPNSVSYLSGNSPAEPYFTTVNFRTAGVNMSNESLYPGDASFRNPVFGTNTAASGSSAPNILSSLFTLPITRLSIASTNLGANQAHIPYIARFNNSDNSAFSNSTYGTQPAFSTSVGTINVVGGGTLPTAGQLLSRDDFEALVLHYRMRGATSYQLLDPGVVGYTQAQEESDAANGWSNSLVSGVLAGTNGRTANLGTTITIDGNLKTIENAGVVWSAVTNDNTSGTQLAILVSNLDGTSHLVQFNQRINGATLTAQDTAAAGSHTLLTFTKSGGLWTQVSTAGSGAVFTDANLASRDGIGIPEPTSLSLIGVGALGILSRRRRKA